MRRLGLLFIFISVPCLAGDSSLIDAIKDQDRKAVVFLIQNHADANAGLPDGSTPLAWAAYEDDADTVEMLLNAGARVNAANEYGETPLTLACAVDNPAIVEKLLNAGADANLARGNGETALMIGAGLGDRRLVRMLIEHGAKVDAVEFRKGQNALMWAAANGHTEVIDILLKASANPNNASKAGFTPLMFAAAQGDAGAVARLLAAGARINYATSGGMNALVIAAHARKTGVVKLLIWKGANVLTLRSLIGTALLHKAEQLGELEIVKELNDRSLSLELSLAVFGLILAILLVVLDKADKLKGTALTRLLILAALMTLPLALGNPLVAEASTAWRWWLRGIILAIVGFSYWGIVIWIFQTHVRRTQGLR
jgi:uncharacterized protein